VTKQVKKGPVMGMFRCDFYRSFLAHAGESEKSGKGTRGRKKHKTQLTLALRTEGGEDRTASYRYHRQTFDPFQYKISNFDQR